MRAGPVRPRAELLRALAHLAEPPGPAHEPLARALGLPRAPEPSSYADVLLFQLHPYASVHLGAEGMLGGEARARVAGFWQAVGRTPPAEPDHLASLVALYASLAGEEGERPAAESRLVARSRRALLEEHLAPWVFPLLARVEELGGAVYAAWARLLAGALRAELDEDGPCVVRSGHLREAPGLPDPRREGAKAFFEGLLAPVRSGTILTRADLGRVAADLDLGLRAGERRYALEHLIAQDPARVLLRLARESARQAGLHERRARWLGDPAVFLAARARGCAALLEALAGESGGDLEEPPAERPCSPDTPLKERPDSLDAPTDERPGSLDAPTDEGPDGRNPSARGAGAAGVAGGGSRRGVRPSGTGPRPPRPGTRASSGP